MFEAVILVGILLGLVVLGVYLLRTFSGGATYADERRNEIEAAVKHRRAEHNDVVVTVTLGWCLFVRDSEGRPHETWVDDRSYQTPVELADRALQRLPGTGRAPPAPPAPPATSWSTSDGARSS